MATTASSFFNQRINKRSNQPIDPNERLSRMPWVEKYRPKKLEDVSSQNHAVTVLKKSLQTANLPHMLFYGPPGTGKTSTILALAKQLYGPELYKSRVLELNASDERGISIVREKIKNFARLTVSNPSKLDLEKYPCPPYKIIILDEADSMTNDAQSALRRTMETYSGITRFCLICNYITRIIDPLASRCSKFRFKPLDNADALQRLTKVAELENVKYESGVLDEILDISQGDLRKAITFLQSATKLHANINKVDDDGDVELVKDDNDEKTKDQVLISPAITVQSVQEIAGIVPPEKLQLIISAAESHNFQEIFKFAKELSFEGWSASQIITQIHDLLILNDSNDSLKSGSLTGEQKIKISLVLNELDSRLSNGTDESIQLLNFICKLSQIL